MMAKGSGISFWDDLHVLKVTVGMVEQVCKYTKNIELCTLNR